MNRIPPADLLLRCGADRESYARIVPDLAESNRRSLCVFTVVVAAAMVFMIVMSLFNPTLVKFRAAYLTAAALCLLLFAAAARPAKRHPALICPCMYVFTMLLFSFGIALGTLIEPNEVTVTFVVMLFAVPLLFIDRPVRMLGAMVLGIAAYFAAAAATQSPEMLVSNAANIIPFGGVSMVVSTYLMHVKAQRALLTQENRILSESDQLTGLWNRRCFEQHLIRLQADPGAAYTVCVMDVNGLKAVNDNLGHYAGDELICGAADCVRAVFGPYGRCYRMGGDEFTAILEGPAPAPEELARALNARTAAWHGTLVSGLAISLGVMASEPGRTPEEIIQEADKAMYAAKAAYYSRIGHDRRRRADDETARKKEGLPYEP